MQNPILAQTREREKKKKRKNKILNTNVGIICVRSKDRNDTNALLGPLGFVWPKQQTQTKNQSWVQSIWPTFSHISFQVKTTNPIQNAPKSNYKFRQAQCKIP